MLIHKRTVSEIRRPVAVLKHGRRTVARHLAELGIGP